MFSCTGNYTQRLKTGVMQDTAFFAGSACILFRLSTLDILQMCSVDNARLLASNRALSTLQAFRFLQDSGKGFYNSGNSREYCAGESHPA